jgi:hypothetical protein
MNDADPDDLARVSPIYPTTVTLLVPKLYEFLCQSHVPMVTILFSGK